MTGANSHTKAAEASVEAVIDPRAVLLQRVGVHLCQSAGATEPAAQAAIDGSSQVGAARVEPR